MFYKVTYMPRPSDYNRNGNISYEAVLQILEMAASEHSSNVGDNTAVENKIGIAWILTGWRVKILRRPQNGECLNIITWVRGKTPSSATYRDFILTDESGREVIRAEAKFALFDFRTSKLTRISEERFASYQPEEREVFESSQRLSTPAEYTAETELNLRRSDIDFNGHVHNTRYVDFALQVLPTESFNRDSFSEIRIVYKKPVTENNVVSLKYCSQNAAETVGIYGEGTLCCLIEFIQV
ncbi:MAG: acyl-[acyl-carrier-protein] thioesterase [Oscillospiraceae bacterium]